MCAGSDGQRPSQSITYDEERAAHDEGQGAPRDR